MNDDILKNNNDGPPEEKKSNGGAVSDEVGELKEKIELLSHERDEYLNGWRRAKADFVNYKNEEMARLGLVVVSIYQPNVRHVDRIRAAVEEARAAKRGLWSTAAFACLPSDHRRGRC